MDLAGALTAQKYAKKRVSTVAIHQMTFEKPIKVRDEVSCYAQVKNVGNTSLTIYVEVWVISPFSESGHKVTEGNFVFVALDDQGRPSLINKPS